MLARFMGDRSGGRARRYDLTNIQQAITVVRHFVLAYCDAWPEIFRIIQVLE